MMRIRLPIVLTMITAVLALAGCGGSSSSSKSSSQSSSTGTTTTATTSTSPSTTSTPSREKFAAQLSKLCERADSGFRSASTPTAKAAVVAKFVTSARSLKPPSQLRSLYSRYVGVIGQELADLKKGDLPGLFLLAHTKAKPLAKQLGATGCVTSS